MKSISIIVFLTILNYSVLSQTTNSHQRTSMCGGRWEFFMSEIAVRISFKIDKFTGEVYQLVQQNDKSLTWVAVKKQTSANDIQKSEVINYQLFTSGLGIRYTFLINTNTGITWQLVSGENDTLLFQIVE